jgi:hypothetical protein
MVNVGHYSRRGCTKLLELSLVGVISELKTVSDIFKGRLTLLLVVWRLRHSLPRLLIGR